MIIKNRLREHIPIIVCKTCGKVAKQSRVIELEDPALIREARYSKRKTWARLIKPSFNVYYDGLRKKRNKRIFFSSLLISCAARKHRLIVRYLNEISFPKSFLETVNERKARKEKLKVQKAKRKLKKGESVNCASCNERFAITDICESCARCRLCCCCKTFKGIKIQKERGARNETENADKKRRARIQNHRRERGRDLSRRAMRR